jgi:hypothetical protein
LEKKVYNVFDLVSVSEKFCESRFIPSIIIFSAFSKLLLAYVARPMDGITIIIKIRNVKVLSNRDLFSLDLVQNPANRSDTATMDGSDTAAINSSRTGNVS